MDNLHLPIDQITKDADYYDSAEAFFKGFPKEFENARYQVLKVETRQSYLEPGNPSFELFSKGDFEGAIKLIEKVRAEDDEVYKMLNSKGVDFLRCRPIRYPFTDYLKWEFETYKVSSRKGERIFCCLNKEISDFFQEIVTHDFMVFDSQVAFVHNYDSSGLIQGGWKICSKDNIIKLQSIFIYIKSFSSPFSSFQVR